MNNPDQKLLKTIEKKLAHEPFSKDGKVQNWVVVGKAQDGDEELLKLLLSDPLLKKEFFKQIGDALVFDMQRFVWFMEMKNYLKDSYTAYKNKIGLTVNGNYLKQRGEVTLAWPFKDCILQGGQTKEDDKRNEVFFHETLGQDQITQLLEPKVLTNATRYNAKGQLVFKGFTRDASINKSRNLPADTITDNLLIKGNNLLALHSLKKQFAGKVKLIYIDPPYNTGNDSFQYNDNFNHSTWLTFMKNRLEVARELLRDDGVIFIQCDDSEQAYLKVLMDEFFGRENFVENIALKTSTPSGVNVINVKRGEKFLKLKEYLLTYSKTKQFRFNPILIKSKYIASYCYEVTKTKKSYEVNKISKSGADLENYCLSADTYENIYSIQSNIRKAGNKFTSFAESNKKNGGVQEYQKADGTIRLVYKGAQLVPLKERIIIENGKMHFGVFITDFWEENFQTRSSEGGTTFKNGQKSEKILRMVAELATEKNDIVLDFFMGSGTTAAVAHKMGRQYIGIEQMDYIKTISVERLKKVVSGEQGGVSKVVEWKGGGEFVYAELKQHNEKFIGEIEIAADHNALVKIWKRMKGEAFLHYLVVMKDFDAHVDEFKQLSLNEQKQCLLEVLDKNQLYVNLSSLGDKDHNCSSDEKKITNNFYQ